MDHILRFVFFGFLFSCPRACHVSRLRWNLTPEVETSFEQLRVANTCDPRHQTNSIHIDEASCRTLTSQPLGKAQKMKWSRELYIEVFNQGGCQTRRRAVLTHDHMKARARLFMFEPCPPANTRSHHVFSRKVRHVVPLPKLGCRPLLRQFHQ